MPRSGLRTKILALSLAIFLPVFGLLILDFQITYQGRVESVLNGELASANFLTMFVDSTFDEGISMATAFARVPFVQELDAQQAHRLFGTILTLFPQYEDVTLVDARDQEIVSAKPAPGEPAPGFADRDFFQRAMQTSRPVLSGLLESRTSGSPVVAAAAPILGEGTSPRGVVTMVLSAASLRRRLSSLPTPPHQTIFVADPSGRVAVHLGAPTPTLEGAEAASYLPIATALRGESFRGIVASSLIEDERAVVTVVTPRYGWVVGVSIPTAIIRAENLTPTLWRLAAYLAALMAVLLVTLVSTQKMIVSPLSAVVRGLVAFGRGDLRQRLKIKTGDELEIVAGAFNQMAEKIQLRDEQLRRSEERYRVLSEAAPDMIFVEDCEGVMQYINEMGAGLLGRQPHEIIGKRLDALLPAAEADRQRHNLRVVCETGEVLRVEEKIAFPGRELWLSTRWVPLRDEHGAVYAALGVARDVTERKQTEQERERLLEQVQSQRQSMAEMVQLISHDLRNPLSAIHGRAQLLQGITEKSGAGDLEQRSVEAILTGAQHMNALIQEMVESTRLESGALEMRREPTDLVRLVHDVVERLGTPNDRARVAVESSEKISMVLVDSHRIERAIANLVTNALKYSPSDAPVVVWVGESPDGAMLRVTDRGEGIPAEHLPYILDRFYRVRAGSGAPEPDGLGLGLYITRLIVEAHGGRIWVESEVGHGSSFTLTLPFA